MDGRIQSTADWIDQKAPDFRRSNLKIKRVVTWRFGWEWKQIYTAQLNGK